MQSFFLPLNSKFVFIPASKSFKGSICGEFSFTRPHFFHLLNEEGVASMFLRAVASDLEQARAFLSKNGSVDLDALRNIVGQCTPPIVSLKKASGSKIKGIKTRYILLNNQNCILHLHMIKEPDQFGQWKIYGVEKE
ncbi:MAG: hypothetical protein FWC91_05515 [Defluviitaleaceae bacterium]|nr:hypothetical protein [Defluviitaleaceae bacterium]